MKFTKPTMVAFTTAAAAAPTSVVVDAWNLGPTTYLSVPTACSMNRMLERERMIAQRMFDMVDDIVVDRRSQQQQQIVRYPSSHQRYELIDNNEKFELKVDVPGVKEEDLNIKLDDGRLTVEGQRMATSETSRFTSKFSKSFSLDKTVDVDKFTASLNNGVLVVSAPKDLEKLEENVRRIPITAAASVLEDVDNDENDASAENESEEHHEEGVEEGENIETPADNDTLDLDDKPSANAE